MATITLRVRRGSAGADEIRRSIETALRTAPFAVSVESDPESDPATIDLTGAAARLDLAALEDDELGSALRAATVRVHSPQSGLTHELLDLFVEFDVAVATGVTTELVLQIIRRQWPRLKRQIVIDHSAGGLGRGPEHWSSQDDAVSLIDSDPRPSDSSR